jgi:hypothetical protein
MATIIIPNFLTQKVVNGLNSYQYTVGSSAMHTCRIEVDHREASTMTVSIVQAGSVNATLATATLPGGSSVQGMPQGTLILQALANCVSGDTLTFVLTSSAPIDEQLNTVKARLNIHVGGLN